MLLLIAWFGSEYVDSVDYIVSESVLVSLSSVWSNSNTYFHFESMMGHCFYSQAPQCFMKAHDIGLMGSHFDYLVMS